MVALLGTLSLILDVEGYGGVVAAGHCARALHVARLHTRGVAGDIGAILGVLAQRVGYTLLSHIKNGSEKSACGYLALEGHALSAALELLCLGDCRLISLDAGRSVVGVEIL